MPTPQENLFLVEQASCLLKIRVRPTKKFILSGTGILPVKDQGAISQFKHKAQVNQYLDFIILDKFYI